MIAPLHILVVDGEARDRRRLRTLLAQAAPGAPGLPALTLHEADSSAQAWALLSAAASPIDLVLLDIHTPGLDGLSLAVRLRKLPRPPALVLVTAHELPATQAFALDALDCLTKPVRLPRLQQTLARLRKRHPPASPDGLQPPAPGPALLILNRGRTERVPLDEVIYFKAELKYVTVRTAGHRYLLDSALHALESQHAAQFLRIHRNALVARRALRALERQGDPQEGEGWAVRLRGIDEPLPVSRRQLAAVRAALRS